MYHQMSNATNLTYAEALEYLRVGRRAFDMHLRPLLPRPVKVGTRIVWKRVDVPAICSIKQLPAIWTSTRNSCPYMTRDKCSLV